MNSSIEHAFTELKNNRWPVSLSSVNSRKDKLQKLKEVIISRRLDIIEALKNDFQKPAPESELTEIHTAIEEINFALKNLKKWMKPKRVGTPIVLLGSHSKIYPEARGVCLIMAPWNYPFYLIISPLISAISAGCVCMLRPSEKAPSISNLIAQIIEDVFPKNEICVALGDIEISKALLELPFDHIFYTGSTRVGKIVMEKASKHLATVTLELGGKSPVIVDRDINLDDCVQKIVWGKFVNAGQTCVAPDYVFVPEELKNEFIKKIKIQIEKTYGETSSERKLNPDLARLIDASSFERLKFSTANELKLFEDQPSMEDHPYFPPTVLTDVTYESLIMQEEIFGPVLPILTYKNLDEVIHYIQSHGKPLALYFFSSNLKNQQRVLLETSSGGAVINHVLLHLGNSNLPFGGVGASGMGGSHGVHGFRSFSHDKAVLFQGYFTLSKFYFPPYTSVMSKICYRLLKYLE